MCTGKVAMYNLGGYCMSKFAVEAMSDVLRQEMYKWGVAVIVIEPGPYVTSTYIHNTWTQLF